MKNNGAPDNFLCGSCSRRHFLLTAGGTMLASTLSGSPGSYSETAPESRIAPAGPASKYTPKIQAAFVRRKEEYGILWPGAIYDGEAALQKYRTQIEAAAQEMGMQVALKPTPIYSEIETESWIGEAKSAHPDGLLLILLDRQKHAWPTAEKAVSSGIPTVIFAPVGAAFTTNTRSLAAQAGAYICSTDDFTQVRYGLKMLKTGAKLREMRFIVIAGETRADKTLNPFGTRLRYIPAQSFLEEYKHTPLSPEMKNIAAEYFKQATRISGPTEEDVYNGVKSYWVAKQILEREAGDGITMDCLGALGSTNVSLPCIAWSRMLDHGIPAACEADLGACITHALVQYLFDRPGFQQDPVPETAKEALIGAHCTCPTRLNGFSEPPEPFYLSHHHGNRDAVPRPQWRVGQRVTVADVLLSHEPTPSEKGDMDASATAQMVISSGSVIENIAVPPSGGCVVSVMVKLDGVKDYLDYPGFHQLFFYGDFKKELQEYCRLFHIEAKVV